MVNKYLKVLIFFVVIAFVVPQIALAAWWNPFSWNWGRISSIFHFKQIQNPVACTMEAKLCPDGSSVGRVPPKCEFKSCSTANCVPEGRVYGANDINLHCCSGLVFQPTTQSGTVGKCVKPEDPTAGWKTYDRGDGFEFKYPSKWIADTVVNGAKTNINIWSSEQKLQKSKNAVVPIYPEFSVSYQQVDSFKIFAKDLLGKDIKDVKDFVSSNFYRFATTKVENKTAYAGFTVANRAVYSIYIEDNNRVYVLSTGNLDDNFQDPDNPKLDKNIQKMFSTFKFTK